ncbi:MAG: TnsA endonuclease N-terminal domain-containing protein [Bacilli bacterium]
MRALRTMARPTSGHRYLQGTFTPQNPQKFIGGMNGSRVATYRSSWELKLMISFDTSDTFLRWGSENIICPYLSPIDKKEHRYYIDFYFECKDATSGVVRKFWAECKPFAETIPPKMPKAKTAKAMENYKIKAMTYIQNMAKWTAAKTLASKQYNTQFIIINEKNMKSLN